MSLSLFTTRSAFIHATLDNAVCLENPDIKKDIEVQTLKKCVFSLQVDSENVYFNPFCKYFFENYYKYVDGIHQNIRNPILS